MVIDDDRLSSRKRNTGVRVKADTLVDQDPLPAAIICHEILIGDRGPAVLEDKVKGGVIRGCGLYDRWGAGQGRDGGRAEKTSA